MAYISNLKTEIEYLKGVGPVRGEVLKKELGIFVFYDLLNYFPYKYIDKTQIYKISDVKSDAVAVQMKGKFHGFQEIGDKRSRRLVAVLTDGTGEIEIIWFQGIKWVKSSIKPGEEYLVYGKPSYFKNRMNIVHPEVMLFRDSNDPAEMMKFQPAYSTTEKLTAKGLDSRGIMRLQAELIKTVGSQLTEYLPSDILNSFKFISRFEAYKNIHFPKTTEELEQARSRLKFEELFLVQLELIRSKWNREKTKKGYVFEVVGEHFNNFFHNVLPFELTNAQKKVIKEIRADLKSGKQMNRLLQGDVGSGKTIVALMSMLIALDNGFQACIMAPTEILAMQHYLTISGFTEKLGIMVGLLTGSTKNTEKKKIIELTSSGEMQLLIGTHALIEDTVQFKSPGLVIIDEQHRFGVAQRAKLWAKSTIPPHVLVMTATPIPRTLAMTFYGDLDTSVIDELPPGRKPIKTLHFFENSRLRIIGAIRQAIKNGNQVYVVYPLIEESEKLDYQNLMQGYDNICHDFPLPEYRVGIVHGKMKPDEKDKCMELFKNGTYHILVSTTVIEVGVDVPNATVMVIESAERFGLSQLHQLRGRVGRGADESFCILATGHKLSNEGKLRMETMVRTNNGFEIAEADLRLRGPGDIAGTQQSGLMNFKIANLATDQKYIQAARYTAIDIIREDPNLLKPEHQLLRNYIMEYSQRKINWAEIS
jgi:ATP-dependent DNA helicase RecG